MSFSPIYKLRNWIDYKKLSHPSISVNPNAIQFLENYPEKILWKYLMQNENAIHLIEKNMDKVDFDILSLNPNAIHILEKNLDKVNWTNLSANPNAIHLLEQNPDKINWSYLAKNKNAIKLMEQNQDKIDWCFISVNPNAIHLIEQNLDKIEWTLLLMNPNAIHILEKNIERVPLWRRSLIAYNPNAIHLMQDTTHIPEFDTSYWFWLCQNQNAIDILEKNIHKVDWHSIALNPNIFILDYNAMKHKMIKTGFAEELAYNVYNPKRLVRFCQTHNIDFDTLMEIMA